MQTFDAEEAASDPGSKRGDMIAREWDAVLVLNLDGLGAFYAESIAFQGTDDAAALQAVVVSDNYTLRYPGGAFYTMSTGLVGSYYNVMHHLALILTA
jgi:hypothetical protein